MPTHPSVHLMKFTIPRAEYSGTWGDFCRDNAAFIGERELSRIESLLRSGQSAVHKAHTAGEFTFIPSL